MTWLAPVAQVVGIAASVVGTGVAVYGAMQQSRAASSVAQYNYDLQRQQAQAQRDAAMLQYQPQATGIDIQKQALEIQRQAAEAQRSQQQETIAQNIASLQTEKQQRQREAVEQAGRIRAEKERELSKRRAAYAGAGVTLEGTPLEVLSDTAALFELSVADTIYKAQVESNALDKEVRAQIRTSRNIDVNAGISNQFDNIRRSLLEVDSYTAAADLRIANMQAALTEKGAAIDLMTGRARAQGYRYQALSEGISGIGNIASSISSNNLFFNSSSATSWRSNAYAA